MALLFFFTNYLQNIQSCNYFLKLIFLTAAKLAQSVARVLHCGARVASCFHSQGLTNNQGLNWSGSYSKLLDLRAAQMTMYWIISESYRIGDENTLSSINTSCCRIHSQSYFPGKGKALGLRMRSWKKAGIVLTEPIVSLRENLTTNSDLSENCWPNFLKKIHYPLPLWGFTGIMKQLIKWNQNVVKESLRIPTSIRQTRWLFYKHCRGFKFGTTEN